MALTNVSGPGKYGKAIIGNLVVQTGFEENEIWNYTTNDDCTLVFTRLDASGEGTATCTTAGGKAPFTDMKFTASPG